MSISFSIAMILNMVGAMLAMAFFTLLERKTLGYMQLRKGPNKVGIAGIPQPFADVLKLLTKEQTSPSVSNIAPFVGAPIFALILILMLWSLYPHKYNILMLPFGIVLFLAVSSMNVYPTLGAGWTSNSKYALLGSLRSVAQTISYEVSMTLILLAMLLILQTFSFNAIIMTQMSWPLLMIPPLTVIWFITNLAETNRAPFDFAEGESEIVSGFNVEYGSGGFALIFMAEYMSIIVMSLFTAVFLAPFIPSIFLSPMWVCAITVFVSILFIWARGSLPRMRYDRLMSLTWKMFLPFALGTLVIFMPLMFLLLS
uniref:NADH-ubiquinone oxidoreductase chain 1 n=1 Tax=Urechis caupo TaxID=6431 RepID=Q5YA33_URECA|nr:NADH dehydrogenase subunit 1 [Urechis caupo]AAT12186.1 NADH dehydrogenase subunit 1 [Urechis caupo]